MTHPRMRSQWRPEHEGGNYALSSMVQKQVYAAMNKCKQCGSTSYKPVIKRDERGVMRTSGQYKCTGCSLVFSTLAEWRSGEQTRT